MKQKLIIGLCMLLFLAAQVSATGVSYESTSVSRLVGNSPEDIINQLDVEELNLNHASYYGDDTHTGPTFFNKRKIVESLFNDRDISSSWNYPINANKFVSNELLIIEAEGKLQDNKIISQRVFNQIDNLEDLKDDFADHYPLLIFDSDYAGIATPKHNSYIEDLTRYSQIIAPTFTHSREFVRALLCNLGQGQTLGHSFREARNRYYETTAPSHLEPIGITLLSYHLYGNPLSFITTPKYDKNIIKKNCGNLLGEKEDNFLLQQQALSFSYSSSKEGDFDILELDQGQLVFLDNLVIPAITKQHELPLYAVITDFTYTFSNPVDLTLNIPEYAGEFQKRSCPETTRDEQVNYRVIHRPDKQIVTLEIQPLAMIDCDQDQFRLYQTLNYDLNYHAFSPLEFEVDYPPLVGPDKEFNISVDLTYPGTPTGELELFENDKLMYQHEFSASPANLKIPSSIPQEGFTVYNLQYKENGILLAETEFVIESRLLDAWINVPENVATSADVSLHILNYGEQMDVNVYDNLLFQDQVKQSGENTFTLQPGENIFQFSYTNLNKNDQMYILQFDLGYADKTLVVSDLLLTNHKPLLDSIEYITVRAGDRVEISPQARDSDGDSLTYTISSPVGNDGVWDTTTNDEGNHTVTITVSDGLAQSSILVEITVLPYNNPPELDQLESMTTHEGEIVSLSIYAFDFDQDNLTFTWQTEQGDQGTYKITYEVDDGRDVVSHDFDLEILEENETNATIPDTNATLPDTNTTPPDTNTTPPNTNTSNTTDTHPKTQCKPYTGFFPQKQGTSSSSDGSIIKNSKLVRTRVSKSTIENALLENSEIINSEVYMAHLMNVDLDNAGVTGLELEDMNIKDVELNQDNCEEFMRNNYCDFNVQDQCPQ